MAAVGGLLSIVVFAGPVDAGSDHAHAVDTHAGAVHAGDGLGAPEPTSAPRIDSVNPGEGSVAGGTTATVSGANFVPGQTRVTICGRTIGPASVTVGGAFNVLAFPTPACDAGTTTITVSTLAGTSDVTVFRYVGEGPPVTGEPQATGPPTGADPPPPPGADPPPPPGDGAAAGLPVTGQASGPLVAAGLLALLVGAALRLAAGRRCR